MKEYCKSILSAILLFGLSGLVLAKELSPSEADFAALRASYEDSLEKINTAATGIGVGNSKVDIDMIRAAADLPPTVSTPDVNSENEFYGATGIAEFRSLVDGVVSDDNKLFSSRVVEESIRSSIEAAADDMIVEIMLNREDGVNSVKLKKKRYRQFVKQFFGDLNNMLADKPTKYETLAKISFFVNFREAMLKAKDALVLEVNSEEADEASKEILTVDVYEPNVRDYFNKIKLTLQQEDCRVINKEISRVTIDISKVAYKGALELAEADMERLNQRQKNILKLTEKALTPKKTTDEAIQTTNQDLIVKADMDAEKTNSLIDQMDAGVADNKYKLRPHGASLDFDVSKADVKNLLQKGASNSLTDYQKNVAVLLSITGPLG